MKPSNSSQLPMNENDLTEQADISVSIDNDIPILSTSMLPLTKHNEEPSNEETKFFYEPIDDDALDILGIKNEKDNCNDISVIKE